MIERGLGKLRERSLRKFQLWMEDVAASWRYGSIDDAAKVIDDNIDQPWAHGPLEDAIRAIRDGIDEEVLRYLARLAAWQIGEQAAPDRRSQRVVGLLLDCDAPLVAAFVHLVKSLAQHWPIASAEMALISIGGSSGVSFEIVTLSPLGGPAVLEPTQIRWQPHSSTRSCSLLFSGTNSQAMRRGGSRTRRRSSSGGPRHNTWSRSLSVRGPARPFVAGSNEGIPR